MVKLMTFNLLVWVGLLIGIFISSTELCVAQVDSVQHLQVVTVKGRSRLPVDVRTITPSQTIQSADFQKTSSYNVADALRNFSGVNVKDYGGIGGLKTVSVRSLGANHTGVHLDGIPITDTQNGQIDLGKINLENVADITLFNSQPTNIAIPAKAFAAGSVLLINSQVPTVDSSKWIKAKLGFTTGSFGLWHPTAQVQGYLGKGWRIQSNTSYQQAHGRYSFRVKGDGSDTTATRTNAGVSTLQQDLAAYWQLKDSTQLRIRANYFHSDRGLPGAVVFYHPYSSQHLWNRDFFIQSSFDTRFSKWQWLTNAKYSYLYTRYLDPDYLNSSGELDQRYRQQEVYFSNVLAWLPINNVSLAYATDWSLSVLKTNTYGFVYPTRHSLLNAFTAKWKWKKVETQATLLHTQLIESVKIGDASDNHSILSPTFLLAYRPFAKKDLSIRAFYKDIFRAPTFTDLYYTRMGNRNLKPEWAKQYNVGITWQKTNVGRLHYVQLTTDAYYNYVKDKIVAVPNKDLFSWTMLNLGEVDIRGVDVTGKSSISLTTNTDFSLTANYTFQEALDVTSRSSSYYLHQIPYTPRHSLSLNAGFDLPKWSFYVNQTSSSHRYYLSENLPEYYVPSFSITDLSIQYRLQYLGHTLPIAVQCNNLFDKEYALIRSFPMPGRSYRFTIQFSL